MAAVLPIAFRADWVFPVASPPLRDGILEIDAAGRIAAIRSGPDHDATDLGPVALVPALVNAHVHLEFSDLAAPIGPTRPFPAWIKNVVAHRRGRSDPVATILRRGLEEVGRSGTGLFGEIATSDVRQDYDLSEADAVLFRELIGPLPEHWGDMLATAERHLLSAPGPTGRGPRASVVAGLSPHAPYTVPDELFERSIDLAVVCSAPVAVHLAETAAELELLATGTGELVEMMRSLGLWRPELHPLGRRPLDWLRARCASLRGLVVHGNHLDDDELDFLAGEPNLSLVYCPRTHDYFGRPPHPFRRLLDRGGRVALGTDGRTSNPDLDLWQEGQFLRARHPDLPSDTILDLATRRGAEALGLADRYGVLAPGRPANFLVVRLREVGEAPSGLFSQGCEVIRVFRDGIERRPNTK